MTFDIYNESTGEWVDITPCIARGGISYKRNDVDSSQAGRDTMSATMVRDRIAIKDELTITCMPLSQNRAQTLLALIEPQFVKVRYISPREGLVEKTMYSNNVPATHLTTGTDGVDVWSGIKFPLIEK